MKTLGLVILVALVWAGFYVDRRIDNRATKFIASFAKFKANDKFPSGSSFWVDESRLSWELKIAKWQGKLKMIQFFAGGEEAVRILRPAIGRKVYLHHLAVLANLYGTLEWVGVGENAGVIVEVNYGGGDGYGPAETWANCISIIVILGEEEQPNTKITKDASA